MSETVAHARISLLLVTILSYGRYKCECTNNCLKVWQSNEQLLSSICHGHEQYMILTGMELLRSVKDKNCIHATDSLTVAFSLFLTSSY